MGSPEGRLARLWSAFSISTQMGYSSSPGPRLGPSQFPSLSSMSTVPSSLALSESQEEWLLISDLMLEVVLRSRMVPSLGGPGL